MDVVVVIIMKNVNEVISKVDNISLAHSFQDACSDNDFKVFAYSLKIDENILMKYTSRLEEAFEECKNCATCSSLESCKNKLCGYRYTPLPANNIIDFSYVICKKQQAEDTRTAYQNNLALYDMPKDIKKATLKEMYTDDKARIPIIKYFKEFIDTYNQEEKPKGIYLNGSFGSGKTYLVAALFNEMAKKGVRSALIYYPEFLRSLKASFQTNYEEQFSYIKKVPLLLFDDIGAENCSNWSRDEVLGPILQYRMENHLPTFFTSNLTIEELEKSLSSTSSGIDEIKARRIIERIKQLTINLELISKNRRN